eukprot:gene5366-10726_t
MKNFIVVVAATAGSLGIGKNGLLPWRLAGDMEFFKNVTTTVKLTGQRKNAVIMGRKTWESIPVKFRPLCDRINVVLSRNPQIRQELSLPDDVLVMPSLSEALSVLSTSYEAELDQVFVIGGGSVYKEAVSSAHCSKIHLTSIECEIEGCDAFFPTIPAHKFRLISRSPIKEEKGIPYCFTEYDRIPDGPIHPSMNHLDNNCIYSQNPEEMQYLSLLQDILDNGILRGDRTGTGTLSKFGAQMRFNLKDDILPLLTTKKVFWRGVVEELLWFIQGSTNAKELSEKGIHIWDGNGSRDFLDKRYNNEGDLGPVYGFQWRHFSARYTTMHADYTNEGVDQLMTCIQQIRTCAVNAEDSSCRRIVMTAWDPSVLDQMALPPCHMFCQFYVADGKLSCQMYQRSADMGLGVPFNIASYALLTRMMAQVCGLEPGDFVHTIGDAHIYLNHIDALKEQLKREPKAFPRLRMNPSITSIDGFTLKDFTIEGYNPDAAIKMEMA